MTVEEIVSDARRAGWGSCNDSLVCAVLNGSAHRATTGGGVTDELHRFIIGRETLAGFYWRIASPDDRLLILALADGVSDTHEGDGVMYTTDELVAATGIPKASIAAKLRDLTGARRVRPGVWRAEPRLIEAARWGWMVNP